MEEDSTSAQNAGVWEMMTVSLVTRERALFLAETHCYWLFIEQSQTKVLIELISIMLSNRPRDATETKAIEKDG